MSKQFNTWLKQAGVLTPATKQTELIQLLKNSPITTERNVSDIAIPIDTEEGISKIRNEVARAVKALPQWRFITKLDKETLTLYIGKFEKETTKETI